MIEDIRWRDGELEIHVEGDWLRVAKEKPIEDNPERIPPYPRRALLKNQYTGELAWFYEGHRPGLLVRADNGQTYSRDFRIWDVFPYFRADDDFERELEDGESDLSGGSAVPATGSRAQERDG